MPSIESIEKIDKINDAKTLEKVARTFYGIAKTIILRGEEHQPLIFGRTDHLQGGWLAIALNLSSQKAKDHSASVAKMAFTAYGVDAYVFTSEAWSVEIPKPKDGSIPNLRPSEHPDRQEILSIVAVCHGHILFGQAPIDKKDGKRTLGEFTVTPGDPESEQFGGRFQGLLPKPGTPILDNPDARLMLMEALGFKGIEATEEWRTVH